ncbi:hypothetical protein BC830DRAFT_1165662 [Chytriomyces sp. MP71]|nr:hypothetical protein BC830DRAFT_1165662 [Chytriomyces sp. MP71]
MNQVARLASRGVILCAGADAVRFLQGLVTNQMSRVERGGDAIFSAFLSAQGRVLYDAFIHPRNQGSDFPRPEFLIDCDARAVSPLLAHLKKYKLRAKVSLDDVSSAFAVHQAWGSHSASLWTRYLHPDSGKGLPAGTILPKDRFVDIGCKDPRHPTAMGVRYIVPTGSKANLPASFADVSEHEYDVHRVMNGIPEGIDDFFPLLSLPLESNLDLMAGVDFRKGCYLGQELTIRTYHTGVTRKRIVPVQIYRESQEPPSVLTLDRSFSGTLPSPTSEIRALEGDTLSKREVGKFCHGVHNIGLALLRLEYVVDVRHQTVRQSPKVVDLAFPGTDLRVRAFAPEWWPSPSLESG